MISGPDFGVAVIESEVAVNKTELAEVMGVTVRSDIVTSEPFSVRVESVTGPAPKPPILIALTILTLANITSRIQAESINMIQEQREMRWPRASSMKVKRAERSAEDLNRSKEIDLSHLSWHDGFVSALTSVGSADSEGMGVRSLWFYIYMVSAR